MALGCLTIKITSTLKIISSGFCAEPAQHSLCVGGRGVFFYSLNWANRNNIFGSKVLANSLVSFAHNVRMVNSFQSFNSLSNQFRCN